MRDLECRVLFAEFIEYRLDGIRRTVIGNDDVEVAIALPGDSFQYPPQLRCLVVDTDDQRTGCRRRHYGYWFQSRPVSLW